MGVLDDLQRARQTFERGDWAAAFEAWSAADPDRLDPEDLTGLATAAHLLGRYDETVAALQELFAARTEAHETAGAVRCAFWLGMVFSAGGDPTLGRAWAGRAERLLEELDEDTVERGYVALLRMYRHLTAGEFAEAMTCAEQVAEHGRRFGDPDLLFTGLASVGRFTLLSGRVPEGLSLFDEAMVGVASGEVSPVFAGHVYCVMIEGCQEVSDLGRAAEWTSALTRWCLEQPGLVLFTGQCAVHRGQIMRLHGAWREAIEEFDLAVERYLASPSADAAGLALAERGDVQRLLGDLEAAEASYDRAADHGYEPQPGLALLWVARGRRAAARAAVLRLLGETAGSVPRSRLLPGAIEALLACGEPGVARGLAEELDETAAAFGCSGLLAAAATAHGAVELAEGDPAGALPYLRKASTAWSSIGSPFELARARVLVGRALEALGDRDSARAELTTARRALVELGARPDLAEVDRLLTPDGLPGGLTSREAEVLRLVASGRSNAGIAAELVLSEKTVARHLSNIFTKLEVTSRTAAAAYAFEHDLA
ncbi:LuxR C-terminal-related transcriptional regulator [Nocardioides donggukensis]|uniref:Helix-turn-helix transcriptional regulator n=1 Tax=Nocardioides donggukensis TaxID=2774019 RepID=A0A927Q0F1_9ACTN|nr:LuxR family transcriptional regulator [Nocardioides donggukensis]MBD8870570.1 helix-turn-helix transcriptional regulator [Nocardioides donggukensis]